MMRLVQGTRQYLEVQLTADGCFQFECGFGESCWRLREIRRDGVDYLVARVFEKVDTCSCGNSLTRQETNQRNGTLTLLERLICEFARWEI